MFKNNYLLLALILPVFLACGASMDDNFTIEGNFSDASNLKVFFDKYNLSDQSSEIISKDDINADGEFTLDFEKKPDEGIYRLRIGAKNTIFILNGDEKKIKLSGSLDNLQRMQYDVEGSKVMQEFTGMMKNFQKSKPSASDVVKKIQNSDNVYIKGLISQMVLRGNPSYMKVYQDIQKEIENEDVNPEFKKSYASFMGKVEKMQSQQRKSAKVKVGQVAPDIALPNPQGETMKLSDLRGKVVLLDFWASWCKPCRVENPHLVKMYNKYKSEGFTVYSVSLDGIDSRTRSRLGGDKDRIDRYLERSKQRWITAIEKDNLTWDYHVSDLKKWDSSAAEKYGVSSIPKTFLIDEEGKIVALNPRNNLEEVLEKHL